jgi:hypothetical protein
MKNAASAANPETRSPSELLAVSRISCQASRAGPRTSMPTPIPGCDPFFDPSEWDRGPSEGSGPCGTRTSR